MGLGSGVEDGDGDGDVVGATDREPVSVAVDDGDGNTVCVEDADAEYDGDCDTDRDDVCVGDSEVVDETDGVVDTDSEADVDAVGESVTTDTAGLRPTMQQLAPDSGLDRPPSPREAGAATAASCRRYSAASAWATRAPLDAEPGGPLSEA